jgi:hypothetical protein
VHLVEPRLGGLALGAVEPLRGRGLLRGRRRAVAVPAEGLAQARHGDVELHRLRRSARVAAKGALERAPGGAQARGELARGGRRVAGRGRPAAGLERGDLVGGLLEGGPRLGRALRGRGRGRDGGESVGEEQAGVESR